MKVYGAVVVAFWRYRLGCGGDGVLGAFHGRLTMSAMRCNRFATAWRTIFSKPFLSSSFILFAFRFVFKTVCRVV